MILHGETYRAAIDHAHALADQRGLTFIHGFNNPAIIAGQGTLGLEILEQVPDVEAIVVPVGGGGMIGTKSGKNTALLLGVNVSATAVSVVFWLVM